MYKITYIFNFFRCFHCNWIFSELDFERRIIIFVLMGLDLAFQRLHKPKAISTLVRRIILRVVFTRNHFSVSLGLYYLYICRPNWYFTNHNFENSGTLLSDNLRRAGASKFHIYLRSENSRQILHSTTLFTSFGVHN